MEIQVRLYGTVRQYRPPDAPGLGEFAIDVPEGATVAGVAERLGMPRLWMRSVFVNGEASNAEQTLEPGDQVVFLPPARGGGGVRKGETR